MMDVPPLSPSCSCSCAGRQGVDFIQRHGSSSRGIANTLGGMLDACLLTGLVQLLSVKRFSMKPQPPDFHEQDANSGHDSFSIKELVDASPAVISLIDTQQWQVRFQNASGCAMFGDIVGKVAMRTLPRPLSCSFCKAGEALETDE